MSNVPLRRGLVDTSLLLDISTGDHASTRFANELVAVALVEFSELSAMTALARCQDQSELAIVLHLLRSNRVHHVTSRISQRAFRLLASLQPPAPLTAADAVVAATALVHTLPVYTLDPARYAVVAGLTTLQPY